MLRKLKEVCKVGRGEVGSLDEASLAVGTGVPDALCGDDKGEPEVDRG